jgi:hypothetical protein
MAVAILGLYKMKLSSSLSTTLTLLGFMLALGIISAAAGFMFGRSSLQGVTQPAVNPILGGSSAELAPKQGNEFPKEKDILAKVEAEIKGEGKLKSEKKESDQKADSQPSNQPSPTASPEAKQNGKFPIASQDKGVSLEVRSVEQQGENVVLNVAIKNESSRTVQFLYTFLDVTDQEGQALTATTSGLATELASKSDPSIGTISIPKAVLGDSKQVSLNLSDYPDQELKLQINNIPIAN